MRKVALLINRGARLNRHRSFLAELPAFLRSRGLDPVLSTALDGKVAFPEQAERFVQDAIEKNGVDTLVAVGGDGTANLLAFGIAAHERGREICMGAIGTGSSNDFHKPYTTMIRGIPYRLDFDHKIETDLFQVETGEGCYGFLNGFGIGFVAEGNWRFNHASWLLRVLKRVNVTAAIAYAAVTQLFGVNATQIALQVDDTKSVELSVCNLNLVKNPHISGSFRYEKLVACDDGSLGLHWIGACSTASQLKIMVNLLRGRFIGQKGTHTDRASRVVLQGKEAFCFEVDGEVYRTRRAEVSLLPWRLQLAT